MALRRRIDFRRDHHKRWHTLARALFNVDSAGSERRKLSIAADTAHSTAAVCQDGVSISYQTAVAVPKLTFDHREVRTEIIVRTDGFSHQYSTCVCVHNLPVLSDMQGRMVTGPSRMEST